MFLTDFIKNKKIKNMLLEIKLIISLIKIFLYVSKLSSLREPPQYLLNTRLLNLKSNYINLDLKNT